jgi:hypothetical protein
MYRRVMAFDGTLAVNGNCLPRLKQPWNNAATAAMYGAVRTHTTSEETHLTFGQLDARLLKAIDETSIPMVGLIAEGLHHEEYQVLLIDPEGDFRGLRVLPRFVSVSGNRTTLPPPSTVVSFLDEEGVSLVLDLSKYPISLRSHYLVELIRALQSVRERTFRPHWIWIVLDEAQEFLFEGSNVTALLRPLLETGGWAFGSYRPDRLSKSVLTSLHFTTAS